MEKMADIQIQVFQEYNKELSNIELKTRLKKSTDLSDEDLLDIHKSVLCIFFLGAQVN